MSVAHQSVGNFLLASLPGPDLSRLIPFLRSTALVRKTVLYNVGDRLDTVYFPCGGLVSELAILADGGAIEVATIGREGAIGISAVFGIAVSPHEISVQIGGPAWAVNISEFLRVVNSTPSLDNRLKRYFHATFLQVSQMAACTGRHSLAQRCAGKLLSASQRSGHTTLPLTHENLASALGVRRAGITDALSKLEKARLIQCGRGSITILKLADLAHVACECNSMVQKTGEPPAESRLGTTSPALEATPDQPARWPAPRYVQRAGYLEPPAKADVLARE